MKTAVNYLLIAAVLVLQVNTASAADASEQSAVAAPRYPRILQLPAGKIEIQMPQIESWDNYQEMTAWSVIRVTLTDDDKTWIGALKLKAKSDIDFDERLVVLYAIEAVESKFQDNLRPPDAVIQFARQTISLDAISVALDVILRALPEDFEVRQAGPEKAVQLKNTPPVILTSTKPAALMVINGEPLKAPIKGTDLVFVVNTNWDLFYDESSNYYYVLNGSVWQRSKSLSQPKWKTTTKLPDDMVKLPADKNWQDVKKHVPAKKAKATPPEILVSLKPAELILTDGKPSFSTITDTGVEWATNTESDLFVYQDIYYYLVSGRWFSSSKPEGPWQSVESLPEVFAQIPHNHSKGHVLAAVPGTPTARAAVIEANIPRKASVSIDAGADIEVVYDGEPQFVKIESTELQRAANTLSQVILHDDKYYFCHNAVWFISTSTGGPWKVATSIPAAIYSIPASDPAHNVTYVYIEKEPEATAQTHVSFAYTSGYYGYYPYAYPWGVAMVYGTGWYYPPYYYYSPFGYPAYYHYPASYGYGSAYNPATGRYARRAVAYGPYGGVAATSVYNPRTGSYGHGRAVWDSNEVSRSGYGFNPNSRTYAAGNMYYDFDDNQGWREGYVQRNNNWAHATQQIDNNSVRTDLETSRGTQAVSQRSQNSTDNGNAVDRSAAISGAGGAGLATASNELGRVSVGKSKDDDLYAGKNGNIYQRGESGEWSEYQHQKGSSDGLSNRDLSYTSSDVTRNSSTGSHSRPQRDFNTVNLNRQYNARQYGSRNYGQFQNMGGAAGTRARLGSFGGVRR